MASLFLNFAFWHLENPNFWVLGELTRYAAVVFGAAILVTALFFVGPALATQAAGKPLLNVAQTSLGVIPSFGVRLCSTVFLVSWMAATVAIPASWLLQFILRRNFSAMESGFVAAGIFLFAFVTGLQTLHVTAKLAVFTNKLGIAILVAALIRVRDGWARVWSGAWYTVVQSSPSNEWHGVVMIFFYAAPLFLLAAGYGGRVRMPTDIVKIAGFGLTVPLFGTLLIVGVIDAATLVSRSYQPSLWPNVAMALWMHVAGRALPGLMMVASFTIRGALRFGARALDESVKIFACGSRAHWAIVGSFIPVIAWLSNEWNRWNFAFSDWLVTGLAVASAVITADFMFSKGRDANKRKVDWVGTTALVAGWTAVLYLPKQIVGTHGDSWWHPGLLPSYGMGFLVCLIGRALQKLKVEKAAP
jgi:hypothetical protein